MMNINFDDLESEGLLNEGDVRFRELFNQMSEGFALHKVIYDSTHTAIDYRIVEINPAFERQVGISATRAKGKLATKLYQVNPAPYLDIYVKVAETGKSHLFQTYFPPLDRYFDVSVFSPQRGYFATVFSDITDRKLVEETQAFMLKCGLPSTGEDYFESMARYISETLRMEYVCIDRLEGDCMTAQTVAVFGNGEFIPNIRYALKDTPCGKLLDDRVSYYKSGLRQLFPFDAALHEWKAESYFGTTLFDSKGKPIGLIAVLGRHPLKMRKRAEDLLKLISPHAAGELERRHAEEVLLASEAQLHQLNAAKDKFFSIIAHDLKNPFNTIIGFSDILFEQVRSKDYEGIEKYAEIIQQSSHRAMDLLSNLLEWSRSQTGRMIYNPEFVDVVSLIHETVNLLNDSAHQKSITINLKLPAKLPFILDKDMINSVLRNIISNAVKFTFENGMIDISAEQTQDDLLVAVKDNGVGIEQGDIDKLFRIDENSSTPGTQKEMGTGLGLILCKDFIEKHGGRIWVESAMGEGSTFFFQIPAVTYT